MDLESVTPIAVSQKWKNKYCILMHVECRKTVHLNLLAGQE